MLKQHLEELLKNFKIKLSEPLGDITLWIDKKDLKPIARILLENQQLKFEQLIDLSAVDFLYHNKPYRFEAVYHFLSLTHRHRLRVKCALDEKNLIIASLHDLWECANWYERECYDMYGINFHGHPDLRRILMYDGFEGYPLRKDYLITKEQPIIPLKQVKERTNYMKKTDL